MRVYWASHPVSQSVRVNTSSFITDSGDNEPKLDALNSTRPNCQLRNASFKLVNQINLPGWEAKRSIRPDFGWLVSWKSRLIELCQRTSSRNPGFESNGQLLDQREREGESILTSQLKLFLNYPLTQIRGWRWRLEPTDRTCWLANRSLAATTRLDWAGGYCLPTFKLITIQKPSNCFLNAFLFR